MDREQLAHALRSAGTITGADEFILIGSQSILGSQPEADIPEKMSRSNELDIFVKNDDTGELTELLNLNGQESHFQSEFGFYLDPVDPTTASCPPGWETRLVPYQDPAAPGITAYCLHPTDLCVAKLIANREKDYEFVDAMADEGLVDLDDVQFWLATVDAKDEKEEFAINKGIRWINWKDEQLDAARSAAANNLRQLNYGDLVKSGSGTRQQCGKWMPRAQRHCTEAPNHAGHCS